MGVMDKFLNYMKLNDEEDEGFYDDDYLDDEEEVEPVKKFSPATDPPHRDQENAWNRHGGLCDQAYFRRGCKRDHGDTVGQPDSGT